MRKALLVAHIRTHFVELLRIAQILKQSGAWEPVMLLADPRAATEADIATCACEGITCLNEQGVQVAPALHVPETEQAELPPPNPPTHDMRQKAWWKRMVRRWLPAFVVRWLVWAYYQLKSRPQKFWVIYYERKIDFARRVLERQQIDVLIVPEDNVEYDTPVLIKVGHQMGIISVVVPFSVVNALEPAEAYSNNPNYQLKTLTNRFIGVRYPHWVYEHNGRKLLRFPSDRIMEMERLGLAPPLPWIVNSGHADAIAVESKAMQAYYLREGLPAEKLVFVGSLNDDILAENMQGAAARRAALYEGLGLPSERPMILCSFPPDQIYLPNLRPECDFRTFRDLTRFWVETLVGLHGYNVVVRLHPRLDYEAMRYIEDWGVRISREPTAALIPLCDIFVASVSATIRWAIACGKPVVNYDVYRYRYTDFDDVPGVLRMEKQETFVSTLQRLTSDSDYYAEVAARQAAHAAEWGQLDGRAADRMLQLLEELTG